MEEYSIFKQKELIFFKWDPKKKITFSSFFLQRNLSSSSYYTKEVAILNINSQTEPSVLFVLGSGQALFKSLSLHLNGTVK